MQSFQGLLASLHISWPRRPRALHPLHDKANHTPILALGKMTQKLGTDGTTLDPLIGSCLDLDRLDFPWPNSKLDKYRFAVVECGMRRNTDSLPYSVLLCEIQLIQLHGMPEVLHSGKAHRLRLDEADPSCFGVFGHKPSVPIPDWKRGDIRSTFWVESLACLSNLSDVYKPAGNPWHLPHRTIPRDMRCYLLSCVFDPEMLRFLLHLLLTANAEVSPVGMLASIE